MFFLYRAWRLRDGRRMAPKFWSPLATGRSSGVSINLSSHATWNNWGGLTSFIGCPQRGDGNLKPRVLLKARVGSSPDALDRHCSFTRSSSKLRWFCSGLSAMVLCPQDMSYSSGKQSARLQRGVTSHIKKILNDRLSFLIN